MRNHPEFLYAMVGLSQLGAITVPVDPRATGADLRYCLERTGCKATIVADHVLAGEPAAAAIRMAGLTAYCVSTPEGSRGGTGTARCRDLSETLQAGEMPDLGQRLTSPSLLG
jgi:acyl-CoA synthetase (AMP-forming)/AMP-acid ligase II